MIKKIISFYLFFLIYIFKINSQTISLNNNELIDYLRFEQISGNEKIDFSFNQRSIDITTLLSKNYILK